MKNKKFLTSANFWVAMATIVMLIVRFVSLNFLGVEISDEVANSLIDAALNHNWDVIFMLLTQIINSIWQLNKKRTPEKVSLK